MSKKNGPGKKVNNPQYVTCPKHGKKGYISKREAKRAVSMYHPGEHMSVFRCDRDPALWHIGHLPTRVINAALPREVVCKR